MNIELKFSPRQQIVILADTERINGRVAKITIYDTGAVSYFIDYWHDGKLLTVELFEDQIDPVV